MMHRILVVFILLFVLCNNNQAAELQNISTTQVGPGIFHKHFVDPKVPWNVDVVEIDLADSFNSIETVKAKDALAGYEGTSSMAARRNWDQHWVVSAINADFFGEGGVPINAQIRDGELLRLPIGYSTIGFDETSFPRISRVSYSGSLWAGGQQKAIDGVNQERLDNQLILYNSFFGTTTGTNQWGKEVLISPLGDGWIVNDTVRCLVEKIEDGKGSMALEPGKAVLSAHGEAMNFLSDHIQIGDTVKILLSLQPDLNRLKEMAGGFPRIVKDGQNYALQGYSEEGGHGSFATDYHPRSAVGYSQDGRKLFFFTVDGRQAGLSRGMSLSELADFMISQGVYNGMNFDGGGSTTMVVRGQIKNYPSDGHERSVANALLAISSAPQGVLSHIQMEPDNERLFKGDNLNFSVSGWDQYYNPSAINKDALSFSVDSSLGVVDEKGQFTATQNGGDGFVFAYYNDLKDSAHIHIKEITQITLLPQFCVIDTIDPLSFEVNAVDEDGIKQSLAMNSYRWQINDNSIASIDSMGIIRGKQEGETQVIVRYAQLSDTARVRVEIGRDQALLDSMDTLKNWHLSGVNIDTIKSVLSVVDTPRTFGEKALRIDYSFIRLSTERSILHLDTDIPVYGVPEYIDFDFKSDGQKHKAYVIVSDDNNEYFKALIRGYADDATKFDTLSALTSSFRPLESGTFHYPIRIKSLWIKLGYSNDINEENTGTLYVDNLRVRYPQVTSIISLNQPHIPNDLVLYNNYPNPFGQASQMHGNSTTTIKFRLGRDKAVRLEIYNILGQKIETLVNQKLNAGLHFVRWNASSRASGLYFYRLQAGGKVLTGKMLLLK